MLMMLKQS